MSALGQAPLGGLAAGLGEHPAPDLDDLLGLLEQRDERVGLHHTANGVLPAYERLDAEHAPRIEVEDRLVHEEELAALDRSPQVELEREAVLDGGLHLAPERDVAIPARRLCFVQGDVGVAQQIGRACRDCRTRCRCSR